jgi:hypothetical protein
MQSATTEASQVSTPSWSTDTPDRPREQRALLLDELRNLRSALLEIDVVDEDVDRDRRLRAALSSAIGAADSLALAARWQPTAAYLGVVRAAVDSVLAAAGRPALA